MTERSESADLLALTTNIVSSHVANNTVSADELPQLIERVYATLASVGANAAAGPVPPQPAVPVRKSVQENYIVCLEDGKKLKMLKRHLKTRYNMTPEEYRERWGLPPEYPMVAPAYAAQRRMLAKKIGLGTRGRAGAGD